MTTISAKVIADSVYRGGPRLTTLQLRYPRWIHAEARTHRVFSLGEVLYELATPSLMEDRNLSRNASSSRAVPVKRLIRDAIDDPAIPIYWGRNQKGMQAGQEHDGFVNDWRVSGPSKHSISREAAWLAARDQAISAALAFDEAGYAKQIVNRIIEPYTHINTVVTATKWNNFWALRDHYMAEPHINHLAQVMRRALAESQPRNLEHGFWHVPYVQQSEYAQIEDAWDAIRYSTARCARVSYLTSEGKPPMPAEDIALFERLVVRGVGDDDPVHASPAEHQAFPYDYKEPPYNRDTVGFLRKLFDRAGANRLTLPETVRGLSGNLNYGWIQFRKLLPGEDQEYE